MRRLHTLLRRSYSSSTRSFEEVRIPVPWGHISGKWWGPKDQQPVLAVHGWQENANSFDPMMRLMPSDLSVLALDMPGNGLSSHYTSRMPYHLMEDVGAMRCLLRFFGFPKPISFLLHSYSMGMGFTYASAYPEEVEKIMLIDFVKPMCMDPKFLTETGGANLDRLIDLSLKPKKSHKEATLDALATEYSQAVMKSVSHESSRLLMQRATALNPDTGLYRLTRDPKLKVNFYYSFPNEFLVEMAKKIRCKLMILRAKNGLIFEHPKVIKAVQDEMQKASRSMEVVDVDGTHHVHMDNPENVVPHALQFLFNRSSDSFITKQVGLG